MIIFSCFVFLAMGILFLSMPYAFAIPTFSNCPAAHNTTQKCNQYVCSLPPSQRTPYLSPSLAHQRTLANQFGNYECHYSYIISAAMGVVWLGAIVGNNLFTTLADNIGRKKALILCEAFTIAGYIILLTASNLLMA
jgi:MFS family permease